MKLSAYQKGVNAIAIRLSVAALLLFTNIQLLASESSKNSLKMEDLFSLDFAELLNLEVGISSNKQKSIREQPSIVSVILADAIKKSGARNLLDILKQVPGFSVGVDAQGVFSLSVRGVWGIDGKVLLIIDGIEQNDLAFSTIVLNNRYSAESIAKIEIIRGPGTVSYGGAAELSVIKVTSVGAELDGVKAVISNDLSAKGAHKNNLTVMAGGQLDNSFAYSFAGFIGAGDYSDGEYRGILSNSFQMQGNSNVQPFNLNLGMSYQDFKLRLFYDYYRYEDRIGIGGIGLFSNDFFNPTNDFTEFTQNGEISFKTFAAKLEHLSTKDKLTVKSELTYSKQNPWYSFYPERGPHASDEEVVRWRGDFQAIYDLSDTSNMLVGLSHYRETMTLNDSYFLDPSTFFYGTNVRDNDDSALFFQYETNLNWANITVGGRYEQHDLIGNNFVPRIAFTHIGDDYHAKLVYNKAFKIPQFGTMATAEIVGNPISGAEDMTSIELEYGKKFADNHYIQGNLFQLSIDDYISYDPVLFANVTSGDVKILGGELILQTFSEWGTFEGSYSYFELASKPLVGFEVENQPKQVLGIPNHMLKVSLTHDLDDQRSLNLGIVTTASRYACVEDLITFSCGEPEKMGLESDVTLYYRHELKQIAIGIGIANLLDTQLHYVQPYRGGQAPTPGLSRRIMLDFEYQF
jgi:outer membrane cobalamin receptor